MDKKNRKTPLNSTKDKGIGFLLFLKRLFLVLESVYVFLWPVLFASLFYVTLLNFGLATYYPLHVGLFCLLSLLCILVLSRTPLLLAHIRSRRKKAAYLFEKDMNLHHSPITLLHDRVVTGSERLWHAHLEKLRENLRLHRLPKMNLSLSQQDPFAIRFLVLICFFLSFFIGDGRYVVSKIRHEFIPSVQTSKIAALSRQNIVTGWITPPEYTNIAPIELNLDTAQPIMVPVGSKLVLSLSESDWLLTPSLWLADDASPIAFSKDKKSLYSITTEIDAFTDYIRVRYGWFNDVKWSVFTETDTPPTILFANDPVGQKNGSVTINYIYQDDYGIESAKVILQRAQSPSPEDRAQPSSEEINLELFPIKGTQHSLSVEGTQNMSFSKHPWAGLPVSLQLSATDTGGHIGFSDEVFMTLPEREFNDPLAKKIIALRKRIITDYPENAGYVLNELLQYLDYPEIYKNDITLFLAFSILTSRIERDYEYRDKNSIIDLMWDIAVVIDDGVTEKAKENIKDIISQLEKALKDNNQEKVEALLQQLEQALKDYQQAMLEHLERQLNDGDNQFFQIPPNGRNPLDDFSDENIQGAMKKLRDLARSGSEDALADALKHLKNYMDNVQPPAIAKLSPQQLEALQALEDVDSIKRQQTAIKDKTIRLLEQQTAQKTPPSQTTLDETAMMQKGLAEFLDTVIGQCENSGLGAPKELSNAKGLMGQASETLKAGKMPETLALHDKILNQLDQASDEMQKQMQNKMKMNIVSNPMMGGGNPLMPNDPKRDPFGRKRGNQGGQGLIPDYVDIPDRDTLKETQKIQNELRRRAGERTRPEQELEYIKRLLNRF